MSPSDAVRSGRVRRARHPHTSTTRGEAADLDQLSIEQDAARRRPRNPVETGVGKKIRSEFADVSGRVSSFDQADVARERRRSRTTGPVPVRESQAARRTGEQR